MDHLTFHVDAASTGPELFRTSGQFTPLTLDLSRQAAANATALREKFPALPNVARYLTSRPVRRGFLWESFDAVTAWVTRAVDSCRSKLGLGPLVLAIS